MEGEMRTTLDLDDGLIDEAMRLSGEKTKTRVIHKALADFINRTKAKGILDFGGKVDLRIDLDALRGRA
jgi:hypothetical protein